MTETNTVQKCYILNGLNCANCAEKIKKSVEKTEGVIETRLSFISQELVIILAPDTDAAWVENKIKSIVKTIEPRVGLTNQNTNTDGESHVAASQKTFLKDNIKNKKRKEKEGNINIKVNAVRLIISVLLLAAGIVSGIYELPFWFGVGLFSASYLCAGYDVIVTAVRNIFRGDFFDENFLMLIATAGAFAIGDFTEAVAVMLFFKTGETLQDVAVGNSRRAITSLMNIRPDYANVKRAGGLLRVSPGEVATGEIILIKPGERIPLDCTVTGGSASIDTSSLTGESAPRDVAEGDTVLSGTINLNGVIEAEVRSEFRESTVQKILELAENAESKKSKTESFITRFARIYTPVVVLIGAVVGVAVPLLFGLDFNEWLYRGLVFLIVSCPCALVISIPLSYFSGIGKASREGVLVKGSGYFDALCRADTVVFDKTGTLTKGSFKITQILTASDSIKESDILEAAAYAENYSSHPIAKAIRAEFKSVVYESRILSCVETAGEGVSANVDGMDILAGNSRLMKRFGITNCPEIEQTHIHIAIYGSYSGSIIISDEFKETARDTIKLLKERGISKTVMLTGDNKNIAERAAAELGLGEFYSQLLPQDKAEKLEILENELPKGRTLVYVGDGINDAPVLARADIGIAMGGLGSDSAVEAADIVIMNDDPIKLITAMDIAARTKKTVWRNIILALGVKLVIQVLGIFGFASMWAAVFADVGVTLIAVLNATVGIRIKPQKIK